ncbi:hypothetical protein IWW36_001453 [Coemansia brasiliensis]|uniref:PLC-like phosphodiesterase n=1 Tax=Coemansia brasiliensis TaxID=2650707 RepID=A0A9W8I9N0_9FUNG|nr:hypothetical protein IWW36_001453 [Coemansia brasiliensis]
MRITSLIILPICLVTGQYTEGCNGHEELCSRTYNNVSYACTHNAYSYPPPHTLPVLNQEKNITQQLQDGIRAFMLDIVRNKPVAAAAAENPSSLQGIWNTVTSWFSPQSNSEDPIESIHLCHESCLLIDKGPLIETLITIREFMEANPREIITLIIENVSGFSASQVAPSFEQSGLSSMALSLQPDRFSNDSIHLNHYLWPTLQEMIGSNQRLVVFMDDKADTSQVSYILPEWDYVVEIPYANIDPVEQFPCNQDRPRDNIPRDLVVMNHFTYHRTAVAGEDIDTPLPASKVKEQGYNTLDSLTKHWQTCQNVWHQQVMNFITLDYYDIGDGAIFQLVNQINGISS